ncbi:hypothetical protein EYC84_002356 [Monilinia fructicola]|uniref:WSC domain-containing protein n=1 Tax=Monilinia fructicola TaxID=38448 RepID=A0A5M9JPS5_MONFR|nr:hypothetical protein EYC84_002356 [Monilinia fructicola]
MFHSLRDYYRLGVAAIFVFALIEHVNGLSMEYCSSLNTASGSANSSIYINLMGQDCWCSDYVPGTTTSTSDCNNPCPGYPDDSCGGDDTFGYMALTKSPSGTKGATSASSTSTSTSTSSSSAKKTTSTSSSISTTSSSTSSTWTPTPIVSLETITGQVRTVTVTPTAPPSESNKSSVSKSSGGLSTGGAVGLTIGLVALVAIIAGIIFFCIRKRRQEKAEAYNAVNSRRESLAGVGGPIPSRTMSENSRYVLGTDGRRVVETWEPEIHTPGSRKSQLMPVDPRLDPFASVYQRGDNKSRESINTIRDDHDYSRRVHQQGPILRAVNPDPD